MSELHEVIENGFYGGSDIKRTFLSMATYIEALEKRVQELEADSKKLWLRSPYEAPIETGQPVKPYCDDIGGL
jgi:hypothetical protein